MNWGDVLYPLFKGPFSYLWPLLALPLLAGLISNRAAALLPSYRADWRVAAVLAALPGVVSLFVILAPLLHVSRHPGALMGAIDVKHHLTASLALLILGRALWLAVRRGRMIRSLTRMSREPGARLRAAARRVGLSRVRELPGSGFECFVAGAFSPGIYVSRGVVDALSEQELRAVLLHERAHAAGGDAAILTMLSFLHDLAPGTGRAIEAYRQARERHADRAAVEEEGPIAVASALLTLIKQPCRPLPVMSVAGPATAVWRLRALLRPERPQPLERRALVAIALALAANFALTSWPAVQVSVQYSLCGCRL